MAMAAMKRPPDPSGRPTTGRIVRVARGQGHAFIRVAGSREVFFHRSDVTEGTFNALAVGDVVAFELIEDRVSGPRATRVRKRARSTATESGQKGDTTP
jgi:cold shock CspA family protein